MAISGKKFIDHRIAIDALAGVLSYLATFSIAWGFSAVSEHWDTLWKLLVGTVLLRTISLTGLGAYRMFWRYVSAYDVMQLLKPVCISTIGMAVVLDMGDRLHFRMWLPLVDSVIFLQLAVGARLAARLFFERQHERQIRSNGRRTLIYGSGRNGRTLAQRFSTDPNLGMWIVGFIDDDTKKVGTTINGVEVIGTGTDLARIIKTHAIQEVVIAIAGLTGKQLERIVKTTNDSRIRPRMVQDLGLRSEDSRKFEIFRDIELSDLLNRPRVKVDLGSVKALVRDQTVVVTGGGGSIGSELVKQIATLGPKTVIIVDHSEYNLYRIEEELKGPGFKDVQAVFAMQDLKDGRALDLLFQHYRPQIVFHAAAYKHVHLVEANPFAAMLNNIGGMRNLLASCQKYDTENFVLISTDKAVNPVGVMGATKRACELMVAEVAKATRKRYCAVRFGNVIGSSGSFIPLLLKQIRNGGPVTITHGDMERYFMLIPEAVSLVLKAGSISAPGDINILRMGEPIRIVDIAKNLMTLVGKTETEVPIVFTGLRPGEKMKEELYLCGDERETEHSDILVLPCGDAAERQSTRDGTTLSAVIEEILCDAGRGDAVAIRKLMKLVTLHNRAQSMPEARVA